jgi:hypothetical protein
MGKRRLKRSGERWARQSGETLFLFFEENKAGGLEFIVLIVGFPSWAEGRHRHGLGWLEWACAPE